MNFFKKHIQLLCTYIYNKHEENLSVYDYEVKKLATFNIQSGFNYTYAIHRLTSPNGKLYSVNAEKKMPVYKSCLTRKSTLN